MRSSWIWSDPKSNDMCLYKRQKRRRHKKAHREEDHEKTGKMGLLHILPCVREAEKEVA